MLRCNQHNVSFMWSASLGLMQWYCRILGGYSYIFFIYENCVLFCSINEIYQHMHHRNTHYSSSSIYQNVSYYYGLCHGLQKTWGLLLYLIYRIAVSSYGNITEIYQNMYCNTRYPSPFIYVNISYYTHKAGIDTL